MYYPCVSDLLVYVKIECNLSGGYDAVTVKLKTKNPNYLVVRILKFKTIAIIYSTITVKIKHFINYAYSYTLLSRYYIPIQSINCKLPMNTPLMYMVLF